MFGPIKEFVKFITSLKGIWNTVKSSVTESTSPLGITQIIERNIDPKWADTLRRDERWNDIKNCGSLEEVKGKALGFAKTSGIPIFDGKSEQEIEEYAFDMGKSLGFLD